MITRDLKGMFTEDRPAPPLRVWFWTIVICGAATVAGAGWVLLT